MLKLLRRFVTDRSGSFAVLTAFLLPVALVATGIAVDYGLALSSSQRLTAAANGAVLSALSEVQARSDRDEVVTEDEIEEFIRGFFAASSANIPLTSVTSVTPRATIDRNEISASIGFQANYTTALMNLFGRPTVPISNNARAVVTLRSYINVNILVDTSQSMGIGATVLDQQKVAQATGCAFACHINQSRGNSSYDRARANGANMRIDVARDAVVAALDAMAQNEQFDGQVTASLYRFSNVPTTILSPTAPGDPERCSAAGEAVVSPGFHIAGGRLRWVAGSSPAMTAVSSKVLLSNRHHPSAYRRLIRAPARVAAPSTGFAGPPPPLRGRGIQTARYKLIPVDSRWPILPPSLAQGRMRSERSAGDSRGGGVATAVGLGCTGSGPGVSLLRRGTADRPVPQPPRQKARHPEAHAPLLFPEVYCASGPVPPLPVGKQKERNR
jgi:Flp pilus assembly protein TadG